jgi:hypothetical protein
MEEEMESNHLEDKEVGIHITPIEQGRRKKQI